MVMRPWRVRGRGQICAALLSFAPCVEGRKSLRVTIEADDLAGFESAARELGKFVVPPMLVLLHGNLGAGKTTFVSALLKSKGIDGVNSPTFNLRNDYNAGSWRALHLDLYRLKPNDNGLDLLPPDEDYSNAIVFVEWPEKAQPGMFALFDQTLQIDITHTADGRRTVSWQNR